MRLRLARESCPGATTAQIELPPRTAALETAPAPAPAAAPTPVAPPAPVRAAPAPSTFTASAAVKPIYFDFDRDVIRPADARTLDANAQWLKANPATLLLVEGHCDERGTNEYNIALGERRARAAMKYLVEAGVAADRISLISYGEERPVCAEHTEACWALNRRAVFLVKPR
ncbi:MAG: peptidoglycan-associated lipoprotein Pal [Candidatus Rokubacteria bacterium]|nr:peptidoglycan-associated lipoprotein Pal [Candidatus Rokubacteria bacterium]